MCWPQAQAAKSDSSKPHNMCCLTAAMQAHQKLGLPTIKCRVRKATQQTLRMHLM